MIKDISPIANCARLTELNLSSNKIEDISSLAGLAGSGNLYILKGRVWNPALTNNKINFIYFIQIFSFYLLQHQLKRLNCLEQMSLQKE